MFFFSVGLFIRPFQDEAWYASLLLTALMVLMVLIPFMWNADYDSTDSAMITQVKERVVRKCCKAPINISMIFF